MPIVLPAPALDAAQVENLARFLTGCSVLVHAPGETLEAHGIVSGAIDLRRLRDDPLRWLDQADDLTLAAFWLLVEANHAARDARPPP